MVVFPNCKINLGLRVCLKRTDGFHNLETIFYPVPLNDALEIIHADSFLTSNKISFSISGTKVTGNEADNLCIKAYELLLKDFPALPPIQMHLHKNIPMGAGLGGGSANAAFTLQLLNDQFKLNISEKLLLQYSLQLGSDCPFFIINKPCLATGRGEMLEPIDLNLMGYQIVLVNPGIHINTSWAFSKLHIQLNNNSATPLTTILNNPIESWKKNLVNDFETPVFDAFPEIKLIKETLYNLGALYASMSGSGSSIFALFKNGQVPDFNFPNYYFIKTFQC